MLLISRVNGDLGVDRGGFGFYFGGILSDFWIFSGLLGVSGAGGRLGIR